MRLSPGLLCLVAAAAACIPAALGNVRGVHSADLQRFTSGQDFTCGSSGKSIPPSRLNDNYCDCPDGSDEPGAFDACSADPLRAVLAAMHLISHSEGYCNLFAFIQPVTPRSHNTVGCSQHSWTSVPRIRSGRPIASHTCSAACVPRG